MFITLTVLIILIALLGFYTIQPLLKPTVGTTAPAALGSEKDLRRLIAFRDNLLASLMQTIADENLPEEVRRLSPDQAREALIRVCEILKNAGMPYLPTSHKKQDQCSDSGNSGGTNHPGAPTGAAHQILLLFTAVAAATGALTAEAARAQGEPTSRMPPLLRQSDGTDLAQIHQFILSPDQGQLRAYYLSLFYTAEVTPVKVRIPSPDGATEFDFSAMTDALVAPDQAGQPPVLELTSQPGINQIRGTFMIPAFSGAASWKSSFFQALPGVTLIILPEYSGVLEKLFGKTVAALNIWPPRITTPPPGFEFARNREQPNERDPNFSRMKTPPEQYSFHYFRRGDDSAPYPEFQVSGIAANRTPGELIVVFFGMMLMGIALFSTFRTKNQPIFKP